MPGVPTPLHTKGATHFLRFDRIGCTCRSNGSINKVKGIVVCPALLIAHSFKTCSGIGPQFHADSRHSGPILHCHKPNLTHNAIKMVTISPPCKRGQKNSRKLKRLGQKDMMVVTLQYDSGWYVEWLRKVMWAHLPHHFPSRSSYLLQAARVMNPQDVCQSVKTESVPLPDRGIAPRVSLVPVSCWAISMDQTGSPSTNMP